MWHEWRVNGTVLQLAGRSPMGNHSSVQGRGVWLPLSTKTAVTIAPLPLHAHVISSCKIRLFSTRKHNFAREFPLITISKSRTVICVELAYK